MKRKVVVITGTRAEYGILKPLLNKIDSSSKLELKLIVTGMHLLKKFGNSLKEIIDDGVKIHSTVQMYSNNNFGTNHLGIALGKAIEGFTKEFLKIEPHIVIIFGDRLEVLAATLAASTLGIPIFHIQAGDKTDSGHIDESIRNSISFFSHILFSATKKHSQRLIKMGIESWRIFEVGSLGIDSLVEQKIISKEKLYTELKIDPNEKTIVCLFHPVHLESKSSGKQMSEILKSIAKLKIQTIVIYPNNDNGCFKIIEQIEKYRKMNFIKIFKNIEHEKFLSLLYHADLLLGNSSSGLIESPTLKLPVINIGSRNTGREHSKNILFVNAKKEEIINAIKTCFVNKKFKLNVKRCKNPYGDGNTSEKIVKIISEIELNEKLLRLVRTN